MSDEIITHADEIGDRRTRLSLLFGLVVWFIHLNTVYPFTSLACKWGWFPSPIAGMPGLRFAQIVLTFAAALLLIVLMIEPWRSWRGYQTSRELMLHDTEKDRRPFVAFITLAVNAIFLIFVLTSLVPITVLNPCA